MSARADDTKSAHEATRVIVAALQAATEDVRREVLFLLLADEDLRDDVEAALLWEERKNEEGVPLRELLKSLDIDLGK